MRKRPQRKAREEEADERSEPQRLPTLRELRSRLLRLTRASLDRWQKDLEGGRDPRAAAVASGIGIDKLAVLAAMDDGSVPIRLPQDEAEARKAVVQLLWSKARHGAPGPMRKIAEDLGLADIVPGATISVKWVDPPEVVEARERKRAAAAAPALAPSGAPR